MKIHHPIPPGTTILFKAKGKRELQRGTVSKPFLLGTRTWSYVAKVDGKDRGVLGSAIVGEDGRKEVGEDGWGE